MTNNVNADGERIIRDLEADRRVRAEEALPFSVGGELQHDHVSLDQFNADRPRGGWHGERGRTRAANLYDQLGGGG